MLTGPKEEEEEEEEEGRRCFGSLKRFQGHLTIRPNANIFLWPVHPEFQFHKHRLILCMPQPERL
jgi:hypothetical protein